MVNPDRPIFMPAKYPHHPQATFNLSLRVSSYLPERA